MSQRYLLMHSRSDSWADAVNRETQRGHDSFVLAVLPRVIGMTVRPSMVAAASPSGLTGLGESAQVAARAVSKRAVTCLGLALAVSGVVVAGFREVIPRISNLYPQALPEQPYFVPAHASLLYLAMPLAVLAALAVLPYLIAFVCDRERVFWHDPRNEAPSGSSGTCLLEPRSPRARGWLGTRDSASRPSVVPSSSSVCTTPTLTSAGCISEAAIRGTTKNSTDNHRREWTAFRRCSKGLLLNTGMSPNSPKGTSFRNIAWPTNCSETIRETTSQNS